MRIYSILTLLLFLSAALAGWIMRGSLTNRTESENPLDSFMVGFLNDEMAANVCDVLLEKAPESNYILKVKAVRPTEYFFLSTKQAVEVVKIYQGENLKIGDEIDIIRDGGLIFWNVNGIDSINMHFVNEMAAGEEYLVFLDRKADSIYPDDQVYITEDFIMTPIFSYQSHENKLCSSFVEHSLLGAYTEVKENEFFMETAAGLAYAEQLKEELLKLYP